MSATALSGKSSLHPRPGNHDLWTSIRVVFVIMLISSLAFYVMAFRVPVVSYPPALLTLYKLRSR